MRSPSARWYKVSGVEGSYMGDKMVERRRPVMQSWANYVCNETEADTATVLPFKARADD